MATNPIRSRERGFTLIEVMIAMVLTAIAIMGIIALYITETRAGGFSRHTTEAAVLAEDKVEKLRTMPSSPDIASTVESGINETGHVVTGGIYSRTYSQIRSLTVPSYCDIAVTVTWTDDGVSHSVTVYARRNF